MEDLDAASVSPLPAMADPDSSSLDVIFDVETDPGPASLEAAMQVPITVMLGPAGPLIRKLHLQVPSNVLTTDEIRRLKVLCISLKNMSGDDEASFMVRWWMKMVRELCYDTEDHLDKVSAGAGADLKFSGLIACARDMCERRNCFQWSPKTTKWGIVGVSRLKPPLPLGAYVEPPKKLFEMLALDDDEKLLKVIPINGCAGVGKTTVARTLYHRHGGKFQCRAFITVSRNPYMRGLLNRMLSQLKAPLPDNFPDVQDLIDAINKHLQGKR